MNSLETDLQNLPNNDMPCFDRKGKYIGMACTSDGWLNILDGNSDTNYQIPLINIQHIINLSDPCMPSGYYQEIRSCK